MINVLLAKIFRRITKLYHGSKYSKCYIHFSVSLNNKKLICIGDKTEIGKNCIIRTKNEMIMIGKKVQINPFTVIYGDGGVTIGNNTIIAPHCMIVTGNHEYRQTNVPIRDSGYFTKGPIVINEDVWISANCTIGDGVTIGKGAVIAANSFVNKDVAPYDIVGGVPARKIGSRLNYC